MGISRPGPLTGDFEVENEGVTIQNSATSQARGRQWGDLGHSGREGRREKESGEKEFVQEVGQDIRPAQVSLPLCRNRPISQGLKVAICRDRRITDGEIQ